MNKYAFFLFTLFSFGLFSTLSAQTHIDAYAKGMRALNNGDREKGIELLKQSLEIKNDYADAWYYLGFALNLDHKYEDAAYSFSRLIAIAPTYNASMYGEASKALIELNRLDDARDAATAYIRMLEDIPSNELLRHQGMYRKIYAENSPGIRNTPNTMTDPQAIASINSNAGDYMPQVSPTGTRLYFTSVRQGGFDNQKDSSKNNYGEDLYFSNLIDSMWSAPELLPEPLNSMGDDFGSAFTGDGQLMIYVRCGSEESIGNCDLYFTELTGTSWSAPKNMGNVVNSDNWDSQPTISSDGKRIIFTSARDGGYGGSDIYMTEKNQHGVWGIPQNLGGTVNTPFNENSPYLAPDGKTLYYSSNGHPGFGGMDVFYTVFENGTWSLPINLGAPLNSGGDDTNFSISALGMGYFSSSRQNGGDYEIFEIELPDELKPKATVVVQGIVSNSKTSDPLEAVVLIEDINSGELLSVNKSN
ncbi:MAG: Tol biopolymer transport system component, partial [Cyclobacteriaceae bacterium]